MGILPLDCDCMCGQVSFSDQYKCNHLSHSAPDFSVAVRVASLFCHTALHWAGGERVKAWMEKEVMEWLIS
jgi:hypothetical protein